ncbi:KxYKxGKxW signal peptide domain-containing protein [Lactobacillaceae bacterium Melli_B3]
MDFNNKSPRLHYKMYKSGKKWIIAGIVTMATGTGIMMSGNIADASTNTSSAASTQSESANDKSFSVSDTSNTTSSVASTSSNLVSNSNYSTDESNVSNNSNVTSQSNNSVNSNANALSNRIGDSTSQVSTNVENSTPTTTSTSSNTSSNNSSNNTSTSSSHSDSNSNNSSNATKINSSTTALNDTNTSLQSSSQSSVSSSNSTPEELMNNTVLNQNFHYNVPRGYSNDIQTILPHTNSDGKVDYYDIYYLYNPYPDQHGFSNEWYHVQTSDFKTFTPPDSSNPTSVNNVAIPDAEYKDENGNSNQVADNNKDGIPWTYVATGSVLYNNGLLKTDQWGNQIDSDAKLAYFTSILPNQNIYLAYSNNDQQFHPYSDKPTITAEDAGLPSGSEFRDPQIVRLDSNKLVSYVAGGYASKMYVLTSDDGINWSHNASDDVNLKDAYPSNPVEVETPVVKTINNNAFMFFSWHSGDIRVSSAVNGIIDNNGLFKTNGNSKIFNVDGAPYRSDTYAGNYTNIDPNILVNINWSGNWLYSPLGVSNGYKYFTEHGGSFTLPRLIQDNNGQLQYVPIEPNNQLVVSYKTGTDGQSTSMVANTNNKLDFSFDNLNTPKTINLTRKESDISITIGDGKISVKRDNSINSLFSKDSTIPLNTDNISKLEMYVDNASVELYIPESKQSYNIVNLSTKQNEPYKMTVNTGATIDNYEFNNSYPSLSTLQLDTVINNLNSNVSNDGNISKSLSSIVNSYAASEPQDSDYASLSTMLSTADTKLSSAVTSISTANSYASVASSMSNDSRSTLYLALASSAYADASNAENYSVQSIMTARNTLATKAPSASEVVKGKQVINGHNVMFIDGKQVSGQIYTDSDGQSHYYDSINGYEGINLFYLNDGKYYYFDNNGNMVKNKFVAAVPNTDYNYYFGVDGAAVDGHQTIDGNNYLFSNGIQVKDTVLINSDNTFTYYDKNGLVATSPTDVDGQTFNFDQNGKLSEPNQFIRSPFGLNTIYYLDNNSQITKGFKDINGSRYYFDNNGYMVTNQYVNDDLGNALNTYYLGSDGKAVTGKQTINGTKRFFNSNGIQVKNVAVIDTNGRLSFYDTRDGNPIDSTTTLDDKAVSFDQNDNVVAQNEFVRSPLNNNIIYYLDASNKVVKGFQNINGGKYYFNDDGTMATNQYVNETQNNVLNTYYFGSDGKPVTGKQNVNGTKRFFNNDGVQVKNTAIISNDGKLSFYDTRDGNPIDNVSTVSGQAVSFDQNDAVSSTNVFVKSPLNNDVYYVNSDGKVAKGFNDINGYKYYFSNNGILLTNNSVKDNNGTTYQANGDGKLVVTNNPIPSTPNNNGNSSNVPTVPSTNTGNTSSNNPNVVPSTNTGNTSSSNPNVAPSTNTGNTSSNNPNVAPSTNTGNTNPSTPTLTPSTNTGNTITPVVSTGGYVATPTGTTSSSSSANSSSASSSATSSSASSASSAASSASSSASSSSATSSASSSEPGDDTHKSNEGSIASAKAAMIKAQRAVKVAEKNKQQSHSKTHIKNYNKELDNYYKAEYSYLKTAKLYNSRYYYDFDKVTKHSKYVKVNKLAYVHNSKKFTDDTRVSKLKKGTKVKVKKIVRHGKTTRFNIGHNKFITGLKSFIHKLTK